MVAIFVHQIQSEYYGENKFLIEVITFEQFSDSDQEISLSNSHGLKMSYFVSLFSNK